MVNGKDHAIDTGSGDYVGGDRITTGHIEGVGIAIGTGASVQIYGDVHYYPIKLRAPLREVFDPLIEDRTRLFGGRDTVLAAIANFIQNPAGGYLVITAPAGFGKTALIASLVSSTPDAFAYHFFTPLYGDGSLAETFFLRNVVEQMAQWHGHTEQLPDRLNELRALYQQFINEPLKRTQVLILDGLDEVTRWTLAPYLSRRLPEKLHIIVTVRDVGQDWQAEYKLPDDQTTHLPLGGLQRDEVTQVLRAGGEGAIALADDPTLLAEVMRVSAYQAEERLGADPFYVRLLAEDAAEGRLTPENVADQPQGLDAYLDVWWQRIKEMAGEKPARDLFGTLTVALGPIGRAELEAINHSLVDDWAEDFFDDVLSQVQRWVVGDEARGYALAHPRLRQYMRPHIRIGPYLDTLLAYCAHWQEHRSPYAFAHYAEHLAQAGQTEALYALIDKPWMDALFEHTYAHRAFAEDVALAIETAGAEEPLNWVQLVRDCLIYAAVSDLATNVTPEALGVLAQLGQVARARDLAALIEDPWRQSQAYLLIGEALSARGEITEARTVLARSLATAVALDEVSKPLGLGNVARALAYIGDRDGLRRALTVAETMEEPFWRAATMNGLAGGIAEMGDFDWALEVAEAIDEDLFKTYALSGIARTLALTGHPERAAQVVQRALAVATAMEDAQDKVAALNGIARDLAGSERVEPAAEVAGQALRIAENIVLQEQRASAMCGVAESLAAIGYADQTLRVVEAIEEEAGKVRALISVARHMIQAGDRDSAAKIISQIQTAAETMSDGWEKTSVTGDIAESLAQIGEFDRAVALASAIDDENHKAFALNRIVKISAQARNLEMALEVADAIGDQGQRASALCHVAQSLAQLGRTDEAITLINRAVTPLSPPGQAWGKVSVLNKVAQALFQTGSPDKAINVVNQALLDAATIEPEWQRACALADIARTYVEIGDEDRISQILALIESFKIDTVRVDALSRLAKGFSEAGQTARALELVEKALNTLGTVEHNLETLGRIAEILAWAGNKEKALALTEGALTTAEATNDEGYRAMALGKIARALAEVRDEDGTSRALAMATAIADDTNSVVALRAIAEALVSLDHRDRAVGVAHQAVAAAEAISSKVEQAAEKAIALDEAVWALASVAEFDRALEVATTITFPFERAHALNGVTRSLVQAGELNRAQTLADLIEENKLKGIALAELAYGLGEAGTKGNALQALSSALNSAKSSGLDGMFRILERGITVLKAIDQGKTLWRVYEIMMEVESWWGQGQERANPPVING